jgi:DNA-binding CsgD family transcriptional regulator
VPLYSEAGGDDTYIGSLKEKEQPTGPGGLMGLGLTARAAKVLFWIAQDKSNPDLAPILGAALRTVHKHVAHIFQKLGVEARAAAAITALERLRTKPSGRG